MIRLFWMVLMLFAVSSANAQLEDVLRGRELQERAMASYRSGDIEAFFDLTEAALAHRPHHPGLVYNMAAGHALLGRETDALRWLARYASMGLTARIGGDDDFAALGGNAELARIAVSLQKNGRPFVLSTVAFSLDDPQFFAEGIAYDRTTRRFLVSSVFQRKVVGVFDDRVEEFAVLEKGRSPLGISADPERRLLWVAASTVSEAAEEGRAADTTHSAAEAPSAVLAYSLESGELIREIVGGVFLSDVTVDSSGTVFVSDARGGRVYRVASDGKSLIPVVGENMMLSPQGIAMPPGEAVLFVADYGMGVHRIDLESREAHLIGTPERAALLGIDGLLWHDDRLVAIQNGIRPQRLLSLSLNSDRTKIVDVDVLESAHPNYDEPTNGVVVDRSLYYVANGQWSKMAEGMTAHKPIVLRLDF